MTRRRDRFWAPLSCAAIVLLIIVSILGSSAVNAYQGNSIRGTGFWDKSWRLETYVTPEAYTLAQWIEKSGMEELTFAVDRTGANYLLLAALTDARIFAANPSTGVQSYIDMTEFFDPGTSRETRLMIIEDYGLEGFITHRRYSAEAILRDDLGLVAFEPAPGFWVLLPEDMGSAE